MDRDITWADTKISNQMTPILKIRSFTNDQYCLDKVFYTNFYRLKGVKETEKKPVVLDLGAHCGYFTFTALSLGAKKVYAFEPFTPNYKMLLANIGDNPIGEVIPYQLGVYVAPVALTLNYPELTNKSYFNFASIGVNTNSTVTDFCTACVLPLDTILEKYVGEQVDILKLNIGYAEIEILRSSNLLKQRVSNICGEISLRDEGIKGAFKSTLASQGFIETALTPVEGEEDKFLFHGSKTSLKEMFN